MLSVTFLLPCCVILLGVVMLSVIRLNVVTTLKNYFLFVLRLVKRIGVAKSSVFLFFSVLL